MPDWTYHPLRGIAATLLGERRSQRTALRVLATLGRLPGGGQVIARAFGHRHPPPHLAGSVGGVPVTTRLGVVVPPSLAVDAIRALPPLGVGLIEVAPVRLSDVATVRAAAALRRTPILVRADGPDSAAVVARLTGYVDAVRVEPEATLLYPTSADVASAARALSDSSTVVIASPALLVRAGPGWFARVIETATPTQPAVALSRAVRELTRDPRRWPPWWWALLLGTGMVVAGLGATAITLGPVLLWYDRDYLGADTGHLHAINRHLVPFLRHDRITMAGTMVAIGVLYIGLAVGGIRRGWPWAREVLLASGCVGFPTLLYFLGYGFVEPLQTAVTALLFPMFLAAVRRRPGPPQWTPIGEGRQRLRQQALVGQLLMVLVGIGLFVGGAVISTVGLTAVFVPTDLQFLVTGGDALRSANPRLVPFIAHDRAGFGGALLAAATAVTLLSMWGWRRGESWVWWSLLLAAAAGFLPAVVVHWSIGYTDLLHLGPMYAAIGVTATALGLARPYLCAQPSPVHAPARELVGLS